MINAKHLLAHGGRSNGRPAGRRGRAGTHSEKPTHTNWQMALADGRQPSPGARWPAERTMGHVSSAAGGSILQYVSLSLSHCRLLSLGDSPKSRCRVVVVVVLVRASIAPARPLYSLTSVVWLPRPAGAVVVVVVVSSCAMGVGPDALVGKRGDSILRQSATTALAFRRAAA